MTRYARVSPPFVFVRLRGIGVSIARIPMNGCLSNGPPTQKGPRNIGSRPCLKTPRCSRSSTWRKLRWRIERDYQELKSELGLAHFEGRGWRGFHHHATLCIAAYVFLIRERAAILPSGPMQREKTRLSRRRGSSEPTAATRAPRRQFNRDNPKAPRVRARQDLYQCPCCKAIPPAKIACHNSS